VNSLQFTNNSVQDYYGTVPLVDIRYVGSKLNFTGNLIVNNRPTIYYSRERAVIHIANIQSPSEIFMSFNQFSNPDAAYEISADNLPSTFILDLGLNFWDRSNYSAVIQRYVCNTLQCFCFVIAIMTARF